MGIQNIGAESWSEEFLAKPAKFRKQLKKYLTIEAQFVNWLAYLGQQKKNGFKVYPKSASLETKQIQIS